MLFRSTMNGPLAKSAITATSALSGLATGFSNLRGLLGSGLNLFGKASKAIFNMGRSVLTFPFKMMNVLFNMSTQGGSTELAEAIQGVVKEFGNLQSVSSHAIVSTAKEMKGFNATGVSAFSIFGNVAQRMKLMTELATSMGPLFAQNAKEFEENGGALLAFQKGMALSNEAMGAIATKAAGSGKKMGDVLLDVEALKSLG